MSKDELRDKLAELYKTPKDQVSCFGFRTQYGGGKSTGFALVYDSAEAIKKFEPHYRLVRYGQATKIEKASRQQRTSTSILEHERAGILMVQRRQATEEPYEGVPRYGQDQGRVEEEGQIDVCARACGDGWVHIACGHSWRQWLDGLHELVLVEVPVRRSRYGCITLKSTSLPHSSDGPSTLSTARRRNRAFDISANHSWPINLTYGVYRASARCPQSLDLRVLTIHRCFQFVAPIVFLFLRCLRSLKLRIEGLWPLPPTLLLRLSVTRRRRLALIAPVGSQLLHGFAPAHQVGFGGSVVIGERGAFSQSMDLLPFVLVLGVPSIS